MIKVGKTVKYILPLNERLQNQNFESAPAIVTAVHGSEPNSAVNLKVMLNSNDIYFKSSVMPGTGENNYQEYEEAVNVEIKEKVNVTEEATETKEAIKEPTEATEAKEAINATEATETKEAAAPEENKDAK